MNVLIVTHAGRLIGLGHLSRSLVVARALRDELGARVRLLIQANRIERDDLAEFTPEFLEPAGELCVSVRHQIASQAYHAVVFDLQKPRRPDGLTTLLEDLAKEKAVIAGIDDVLDLRAHLDLIFIPAFHIDDVQLDSMGISGEEKAKILFGWDCFLLGVDVPKPTYQLGRDSVLVLTGGSDATSLGTRWPVELAKHLPEGTLVDWVTGPFSPPPQLPVGGSVTFREHRAPTGLSPLMGQAGYALTVFGVSFFELLYYGVPTVVYSPYGDRNTQEMTALQNADVALVARTESEAVQLLRQLMIDANLADRLSHRAQSMVDGRGGARFAQALKERVDSRWRVPF